MNSRFCTWVLGCVAIMAVLPLLAGAAARQGGPQNAPPLDRRVAELEARVLYLETVVRTIRGHLEPVADREAIRKSLSSCAMNLRQLWMLQTVYTTQFGGAAKQMPQVTGADFWLALTRTQPPLLGEPEWGALVCPSSGQKAGRGVTSYRGPGRIVDLLKEDDVVGCCEPGCHLDGTINVLKKSGEVIPVVPSNAEYGRAVSTTSR